jgi:ABC-type glycerol-3-phosphate transport system substrate-binding protein
MNFLSSFVRNYYGVGSIYGDDDNTITVWVARGREWGMIMKDMTEDDFTPASGISVNLQVFPPGQLSAGSVNVLLLSVASGVTPDVATGVLPDVPVEFAIRNGVANMNKFLDYQEVATRFRPGALLPFRWEGGDYAIPETQDFLMMFYRTDIFNELGLTPPDTWQDLYNMIWLLQQRGMDFFFPPVGVSAGGGIYGLAESLVPGFLPFLYQNGGDFYTNRGLSALDSPEALAGFREWTELYTNYKITQQADFYNRMRTGEMPIGVSGFFTYVLLSVAAPELEGRWEMRPLPGKRRPDGQVDRTSGGYGQAVVIMDNSDKQDKAWEWAKWWTSERAQARFGEELEALIGTEARWNTANVKALNQLPFPQKDIEAIQEQWRWFKEQPVTLGGYFTPRHIINAWNRVVLQGWNAREALEEAVKQIDRELIRKREEFGLPVDLTKTKGGLE